MKTSRITIAAIIPTYQRAALVSRAIESVLAQTRPVDEIIVVDDGGTDRTSEVVGQYGPLVRYVRRENGGIAAARNTAVRMSRCDWVAFLDDDDAWTEGKIAKQAAAIEAETDAAVSYTGVCAVYADGTRQVFLAPAPEQLWPRLRLGSVFTPSTTMVRRDVFEQIGGFDERLRCAEDWEFFVRAVPGRRIIRVNEPLLFFHIALGTTSLSRQTDSMLSGELSIMDTLLRDLEGTQRWIWRMRILSKIYYRAAISARERGSMYLPYLFRSLLYWPSPFIDPRRYKTLALAVRDIRLS